MTTTYTDTGQVETITDDRGAMSFGYDERERLTGITYPNDKTIIYSYDPDHGQPGTDLHV